jgi:hypothetical protein
MLGILKYRYKRENLNLLDGYTNRMWVTGMRNDSIYKIRKRPLDPRWSNQDLQVLLGWCANGLSIGWTEDRAFQVAEAIVMRSKNVGLSWSHHKLNDDIAYLFSKNY